MSKERLERIKERVNYHGHLDEDVEWLIEQAERVQELEDIIYKDERQAVLESMYDQNKRYREVMEGTKNIIEEAIELLDKNEKVQGLEWAVKRIDEALEGEE